jgi:hypothetical protein
MTRQGCEVTPMVPLALDTAVTSPNELVVEISALLESSATTRSPTLKRLARYLALVMPATP